MGILPPKWVYTQGKNYKMVLNMTENMRIQLKISKSGKKGYRIPSVPLKKLATMSKMENKTWHITLGFLILEAF